MKTKILLLFIFFFLTQGLSNSQMYYQNSNNLDNVIIQEAQKYNVDRYILEALTKTLMNDKAVIGGFYGMHVATGERISAESLASNLAQVMNLCETVSLREKQDAIARGETYNAGPYDDIINNLQPPYGNNSNNTGITYFKFMCKQIIQREKNKK